MPKQLDQNLADLTKEELTALVLQSREQIAILESEKTQFIESSYDGFWDWNLITNVEYMSPRFWEILGVDPSTKKHHPSEWQDLIFEEDLKIALENFQKHVDTFGRHPYRQEVRYRHSNGSTVTVWCRGQVTEWTEDGRPKRMIGTHTDITFLKKIHEELLDASSFKSQFLTQVSHELRSPLNTSVLLLSLLQDQKVGPLSDRQREVIAQLNQTTQTLLSLITDLLDHSKIEKGLIDIVAEEVDINDVIKNLHGIFESQFKEKQVRLEWEGKEVCHAKILTDQRRLEQILRNLLSNALKFTPPEGCVSLSIEWVNHDDDHCLCFHVKDSGVGVEPHEIETIFFPWSQGNEGKKQGPAGTGLGLAISKHLSALLGGSLSVQSELHVGSTFSLLVPDLRDVSEAIEAPTQATTDEKVTMEAQELQRLAGLEILILDQDVRTIFSLRKALASHGVTLHQSTSGKDAITLLEKHPSIDVGLIDTSLEGSSGRPLVEELGEMLHLKPKKLIRMTRKGSTPNSSETVIDKPIVLDKLFATLLEATNKYKESP